VNLLALGYGLKQKHYDIINRISENVLYYPIQAVDLRSFEPTLKSTDVVILFGPRARKFFDKSNQGCLHYLELQPISSLEVDEEYKEKAWKELLKFKEKLDNYLVITENNLPDMKADDVLSLEASLKEKGVTEWLGKTKDGQTICLSLETSSFKNNRQGPNPNKKADINLTFAELHTLKIAMKVLGIEEVVVNSSN
jgi:hypothetical protein